MTHPDPTPRPADPLDLDRIEQRIRRCYDQDVRDDIVADVVVLLAEARRLRAERDAAVDAAHWLSTEKERLTLERDGLRAARVRTARLVRDLRRERDAASSALDALAGDYGRLEDDRDRLRDALAAVRRRLADEPPDLEEALAEIDWALGDRDARAALEEEGSG